MTKAFIHLNGDTSVMMTTTVNNKFIFNIDTTM